MDHNFRSLEGRAVGLAFSAAQGCVHKDNSTDTFIEEYKNVLKYLAGATTSNYFVKTCIVKNCT